MRLRRATEAPVMMCKRLLTAVPADEREAVVRDYEEGRRFLGSVYTVEDRRLIRDLLG